MATSEYNQDPSGFRSELQEPRRTTDYEGQNTGLSTPQQETGDYGGLSNDQQPPHHHIHTDDELLQKPTGGAYDGEQALPRGSGYGDQTTPQTTEQYRSAEPQDPIDGTPGNFEETTKSEGYSDPSAAFAGAPVDRKIEKPGYGHDVETSEPVSTTTAPESPTPKKEGFLQKLKHKLPGQHKTSTPETVGHISTPETVGHTSPTGTGEPKKGLVTKIMEKLPGHHPTTPTTPTTTTPTTATTPITE